MPLDFHIYPSLTYILIYLKLVLMCSQNFRNGQNQLPYNLSEPLGKLSVNGKTGADTSTQRAKETTDAQLVERVYFQSAVIVLACVSL